uniref:LRP chaperone MESD n=1 Tax=Leptobrachium leishanense TaxID=445787 RepID=A0A8C5LJK6_9ANUR
PAPARREKKKKDIRDYNDTNMPRLLEQWEEDDDIEEGDLPEHQRFPPPVDFSKLDLKKPESILQVTKKGKTLMIFVTVSGNPTEKETEEITSLWPGSLFIANYAIQRFIDGYAWEVKDFLVKQDRCVDVTLEGQVYPGKGGGSSSKSKIQIKPDKKKSVENQKSKTSQQSNKASSPKEDL